jgi:hypothetical protein
MNTDVDRETRDVGEIKKGNSLNERRGSCHWKLRLKSKRLRLRPRSERREIMISEKKKSWRVNAKVVEKYIDRRQARLLERKTPLGVGLKTTDRLETQSVTPLRARQPGP